MTQNIRLAANVNPDGIINYVNKDYQDWTGYSLQELVGQHITLLRAPNFPPIIQKTISEQMRKNQPVQFPIKEKKKNGELYWADMAIQPIFENGAYIGYTSIKRVMTDATQIEKAETLYQKILTGKVSFTNGDWVSARMHNIYTGLGLQKFSLLTKTLGALITVSALILVAAFINMQQEANTIETRAAESQAENIAAIIDNKMDKKADIGITNILGITFNPELQRLMAQENVPDLLQLLAGAGKHYAAQSNFKNIKLHIFNENGVSFLKSWLPLDKQKSDDLSDRGYVKDMMTNPRPMIANALTSAGFNIKAMVPIYVNGKYEGFVEFIQGAGSLQRDFAATGQDYLIAVSVPYALKGDQFRQRNANNIPVSADKQWVVGNDQHFSMEKSGKQIEILRQTDLDTLFEQGYLVTASHYHTAKPIFSPSDELMGYHIVTEPIEGFAAYVDQLTQVAHDAFMKVVIALLVMLIIVSLLLWNMILRPIKQVKELISQAVTEHDLFARVRHYSKDEIGQLGRAYNQQAMLSQCIIAEANAAMEELQAGRLDYRIKTPFSADYGFLKSRINATCSLLENTFSVVETSMEALVKGEFDKRVAHDLPGEYAKVVTTCETAMVQLSEVFKDINRVMEFAARGKLDERIHQLHAGDIKQLQTSINQSLDLIQQGFGDVIQASERMANGDFSQPINASYEFALDAAKQAINASMQSLTQTMIGMQTIAAQLNENTLSVAEGTQSLNERTQEQAASLEQTSASMEQTTAQIRNNLENTQVAAKIAHKQAGMLQNANQQMTQAKESMHNIQTVSNRIKDITSLIDAIAFQTNLLALNAAVEAARAGEHGRGFAVVANEVRNLAAKSADATKQISGLIESTVQAVDVGVNQVEQVGQALESITQETHTMSRLVEEIERASQEQAQGVDEVNKAISSIDSVTQQNAALVEETTAATEGLQQSANDLKTAIGQFKLTRQLR